MATQDNAIEDIGIFGDQSKQSKRQQGVLREQLERIDNWIVKVKSDLAQMEKDRSRMAHRIAAEGDHTIRLRFDECIHEINQTRDRLKAFEEERAKKNQAIAELTPTPAQIQTRQALRREFLQLADQRLKKTRQVQDLLLKFRQALDERIELAGKMRGIAEGL